MAFITGCTRSYHSPCETPPLSQRTALGDQGAYDIASPHCHYFWSLAAYEQKAVQSLKQFNFSSVLLEGILYLCTLDSDFMSQTNGET